MALPQINDTIWTKVTVPSTGIAYDFRPYLVQEEKVLLMAMESESEEAILDAIRNTLESCCKTNLNIDSLALFDFEYLFAQVRANSVGQTTEIRMRCDHQEDGTTCDGVTDVEVDISAIKIDVDPKATSISLTDSHTATMRYPSYGDGVNMALAAQRRASKLPKSAEMFELVANCIVSVSSENRLDNFADEPKEAIDQWLETLNSDQIKKLFAFINDMPTLKHDIEYKCVKCGNDQKATLEGLSDFF
jgi:hypothetical protein